LTNLNRAQSKAPHIADLNHFEKSMNGDIHCNGSRGKRRKAQPDGKIEGILENLR
jgi:hypothetical protein